MNYENTSDLLIYIINCMLNGKKAEISKDTDISTLMKLAALHNVTAMVSAALLEAGFEDNAELTEHNTLLCYIGESKNIEVDFIRQIFDSNNIQYMFMKGVINKDLYPQSYMRQMGDIDIYIKPSDFDKAEKALEAEGYLIKKTPAHHDEASNGRYSHLEIHRYLVGQSVPRFREYYEDGWKFAKNKNGYEHSMTNEDFYIYMVAHAAKHFMNGGIGIRFVTDVYVYLKHFASSLDRTYIDAELSKLKIDKFTHRLETLADFWFGNGTKDELTEELGTYIINCGTFGTLENNDTFKKVKYLRQGSSKKNSKLMYILRSLFPSYKLMTQRYETLNRYPFLLPYFWVLRILTRGRSKRSISRLNDVKNMNNENMENEISFFDKLGL